MEEKSVCLSREEQDSMRALAGEADETVALTQSLYAAVAQLDTPIPLEENLVVKFEEEESATRRALKPAPVPMFADGRTVKT